MIESVGDVDPEFVPSTVRRIREFFGDMPPEEQRTRLLDMRAMAARVKLKTVHSLHIHSVDPRLKQYRLKHGQKVYWGHPLAIAAARKEGYGS